MPKLPRSAPGKGLAVRLTWVVLAVIALLVGLGFALRQPLWDRLDLETKHRLVALYLRVTARRVDAADAVQTSPRVANRIGVNIFLDQEVSLDDRKRSLEMIRAAGIGWVR